MAPRNFKEALLHERHKLPGHERVAYEIHYRMPRRLGRAYQASHFTLIRRSPEDWTFDACCRQAVERFRPEKIGAFEAISGTYSSGTTDDRPTSKGVTEGRSIRELMIRSYKAVLNKETALFVFGAFERVIDLVSRQVVDEAGLSEEIIGNLFTWSQGFRDYVRTSPSYDIPEFGAPDGGHFELLSELGSSRKWVETNYREGTDEWPHVEELLGDFRHLRIKKRTYRGVEIFNAALESFDYYLRWERSPQSWNYTFIESLSGRATSSETYFEAMRNLLCACAIAPSVLQSRALHPLPDEHDFPGRLLAGAHYLLVPIDMLLAFSIASPAHLELVAEGTAREFAERLRYPSNVVDENRISSDRFQRAITDGLTNRRNGVSILLSACFDIHGVEKCRDLYERHWLDSKISDVLRKAAWDKVVTYFVPQDVSTDTYRDVRADRIRQIIKFLEFVDENFTPAGAHAIYRFLGNVVKDAVTGPMVPPEQAKVVLGHVAEVTKAFWEFAVAPNLTSQIETAGIGQEPPNSTPAIEMATDRHHQSSSEGEFAKDFVCSSMIEGRCLYFSNFMPENDDKFTRTLFIDIGMRDQQSARMLQRLTNILTYRSMPIRHLERVNAAIEAILELNLRINTIEGRSADRAQALKANSTIRDHLGILESDLVEALSISGAMARLNGFITYGIAGQWSSSEAYFEQILERCEDLREQRIEGFPNLTDFVKRRLAHSVRFVERMNRHQITIARRITELMDRIRTELDSHRTKELSRVITGQADAVAQLASTAESLETTTKAMENNASIQTMLLKSAEALILIGSTYYLFSLAMHVIFSPNNKDVEIGYKFLLIVLSFILSILFMEIWPSVRSSLGRIPFLGRFLRH